MPSLHAAAVFSLHTVTKRPRRHPKSSQSVKPLESLSTPSLQRLSVNSVLQHSSGVPWQPRSPQSNWPSLSLSILSTQTCSAARGL